MSKAIKIPILHTLYYFALLLTLISYRQIYYIVKLGVEVMRVWKSSLVESIYLKIKTILTMSKVVWRYFPRRLKLLYRRFKSENWCEPHAWVNTCEITHILWQRDLPTELKKVGNCILVGGDWDIAKVELESTPLYQSFYEHFMQDLPWEYTNYYTQLNEGHLSQRVKSNGSVKDLLESYERLFILMKKTGFNKLNPIVVHIGRDGELIRHDGSHRLTIAKLLDLPQIPVRVKLIHQDAKSLAVAKDIAVK